MPVSSKVNFLFKLKDSNHKFLWSLLNKFSQFASDGFNSLGYEKCTIFEHKFPGSLRLLDWEEQNERVGREKEVAWRVFNEKLKYPGYPGRLVGVRLFRVKLIARQIPESRWNDSSGIQVETQECCRHFSNHLLSLQVKRMDLFRCNRPAACLPASISTALSLSAVSSH